MLDCYIISIHSSSLTKTINMYEFQQLNCRTLYILYWKSVHWWLQISASHLSLNCTANNDWLQTLAVTSQIILVSIRLQLKIVVSADKRTAVRRWISKQPRSDKLCKHIITHTEAQLFKWKTRGTQFWKGGRQNCLLNCSLILYIFKSLLNNTN